MNGVDLTKEKTLWVGTLIVFLLLTVFPFTSRGGMFVVFQRGDFSTTTWHLLGELPVLGVFILILLLNPILSLVSLEDRGKSHLLLLLNFVGVALFIIQFVILTPDIPLGIGSFLIFFTLLLYLARSLSRLGFIMGDTFISGSILSIAILLILFILFPLAVILGRGQHIVRS